MTSAAFATGAPAGASSKGFRGPALRTRREASTGKPRRPGASGADFNTYTAALPITAVTKQDPAPTAVGSTDDGPEALAQRLSLELQERDDLLALAAHELRNPLHALTLQLALARATAEGQQQGETASRIAKAQATLARYADRATVLLDLVRVHADAYPLNLQPVDLSAVVTALGEALAPEAQFRGVTLEVRVPPHCPGVTDPLVVEQVVDNLLLNAFKHAACKTVRLELRCLPDGHVELSVADDGRGILAADQARIFDKFGVAEGSPRGSGTGLGLWIVRKLTQVLGGSIAVRSGAEAGCVFTLRIPMSNRSGRAP